jgi:hypothetical protein
LLTRRVLRVRVLRRMFSHHSISITLSPSHRSSEKHLTQLSIKETRHFTDITFQCSSAE